MTALFTSNGKTNELERRLSAAAAFLRRSVEINNGAGSSAYFSRVYQPKRGWSAAYPETTGYLIPTLYRLGDRLADPTLVELGHTQADWVLGLQGADGSLPGGLHTPGKTHEPSVFNTGQMILGLVAAADRTGDERFLQSAERAALWLSSELNPATGRWDRHAYVDGHSPAYYTRVAWPMLEVSSRTQNDRIRSASVSALDAILNDQVESGSIPSWSFQPGKKAFTHTIAYTIRGLIESSRLIGEAADSPYLNAAFAASEPLMRKAELKGKVAGAFDRDWNGDDWYVCLTGNCQLATAWMKLSDDTGDIRFLSTALKVLETPIRSQAMSRASGQAHGSIAGSSPFFGRYLIVRRPNWATKFYADALLDAEAQLHDASQALATTGKATQ